MSATTDAQRLIALSLGKIAVSRQQRCGINLHKNLLVASVLHKARTTYMMDNFQTLLANKRSQAEREAAAKRIVENPVDVNGNKRDTESMDVTRGVTDNCIVNTTGVLNGERTNNDRIDKENMKPYNISNDYTFDDDDDSSDDDNDDVFENNENKICRFENTNYVPVVTRKIPLSDYNVNNNNVSKLSSCRCVWGKRRRSFVDCDSGTEPKKARFEYDSDNNESDFENDRDSREYTEHMQTESSQVTSLVDIFSTGFNGLCKDSVPVKSEKQTTGHQINVYVSANRQINGHQYVLKDLSCGTQIKDSVTIPTAIALAV